MQQGGVPLIQNASLTINPGWRVAVVGRNGCGKSTLFRLVLGELTCDAGSLTVMSGLRLAHMAQETPAVDRAALDYVLDGDRPLRAIEARLAGAEAHGDGQAIAECHARLDEIDGYQAPVRAAQLLEGLGFPAVQHRRGVTEFSGGWRMRLNLAQALMCPSDILLLDEPTNHLDLDAVVWLETWLKRYAGTLLLISHDRDFIDGLATHVLHFENRQLQLYTGNYSQFEVQRASRLAQQAAAFDKQQQRIAEIHGFVSRFGAKATKARQAQSRLKELQRMELIAPAHVDSPFQFTIPCSERLSEPLLVLREATLGYGDTVVLDKVNLNLSPGSRLGLLGANGQGKSTLVKTLAGEISPLAGRRTAGEHLRVGYFSQHQLEALDERATAFEQLQARDRQAPEQMLRNFLGGFGFGGALCDKPVAQFSGGERARLALALIAWQKPNLLLLDEPTNHLDLDMRHALNVALQAYPGALILVSHDRHLMRALADDFIWVHQGRAEPYERSLDDYERDLGVAIRALQAGSGDDDAPRRGDDRRQRKRDEAARRQQLAPLRRQVQQAEARLETLAARLRDIESELAGTAIYAAIEKERLRRVLGERQALQAEVESEEARWLELSEELEAAQGGS